MSELSRKSPSFTAVLDIARELRLNASTFIVTVYGDVVVPRGGILWTGTLIELCACVGINESLVRTAVSRLVAARQLTGVRIGRRSFYRLEGSVIAAFEQAAQLIYGPEQPIRGWQIIHAPGLSMPQARRLGLGHIDGTVFIRPDRGQAPVGGATVLLARDPENPADLGRYWDLSALQAGYEAFVSNFAPIETRLAVRPPEAVLSDREALMLRLLLVHAFRGVLLRDPRLPGACLPDPWSGHAAQELFRSLYLQLTPCAERHVAAAMQGDAGTLPAVTPETAARLAALRLDHGSTHHAQQRKSASVVMQAALYRDRPVGE